MLDVRPASLSKRPQCLGDFLAMPDANVLQKVCSGAHRACDVVQLVRQGCAHLLRTS